MPNRGKNYKKSQTYKAGVGYAHPAIGSIRADVSYLKSVVNSELKFDGTTFGAFVVSSTGSISHLTSLAQGNGSGQRSGISILPKYVNAKFSLTKNPANSSLTDIVRLIWFMWKECTTPTVGDILEDSDVFSHYNRVAKGSNPRDRSITVLMDKTYVLTKDQRPVINTKIDLKMNKPGQRNPVHIKFDAGSTSAPRNGIYLLKIGQATSDFTHFDGHVLTKFYDN